MTEKPDTNSWLQSAFDIRGLVAGLKSEDAMHRRQAAAALGGMNAVAALSALQKAHLAEDDEQTRKMMEAAIAAIKTANSDEAIQTELGDDDDHDDIDISADDDDYVKTLIAKLKGSNSSEIITAANELGEMGEKIAVEALIIAFNNPKHTIHVRLTIAEALLKLESAPVEVALLANLRHTDWHIRRNGAAILGQLQAEWAVEPLANSLEDPHPVVRRTALAALKYIGTPESRKALAKFTPSDNQVAKKNVPTQLSGIEVKRPGKVEETGDDSPLLKRLQQEREAAERARRGTQPFGDTSEFIRAANEQEAAKKIDATQPIRDNILDQLGAILENEDSEDGNTPSEE